MAHTITIGISPAAQRAALLAGEPATATQVYEVPAELLPALLALPWTQVDVSGVAACEVVSYERAKGAPYRPADAAAAIAYCSAIAAREEEERAIAQAEREAAAAAVVAAWQALPTVEARSDAGIPDGIVPMAAVEEVLQFRSLRAARLREAREAEAAEVRRLRRVRQARLAALVREHGTPEDVGRIELRATEALPLGALHESDAERSVIAWALPVTPECPDYTRVLITERDIESHCDEDCSTAAQYRTEDLVDTHLAARSYVDLVALRAAIKAAGIEGEQAVRVHRGQCQKCGPMWPVERVEIQVTRDLGDGVIVSREYGLPR